MGKGRCGDEVVVMGEREGAVKVGKRCSWRKKIFVEGVHAMAD